MSQATPAPSNGRYTFLGRDVGMPVVVREASSLAATYLVPSGPAEALLAGPELEVAEVAPGWGLFSVACIDYRDNDLGDYNEVSLALFVRLRGAGGVPWLGTIVDFFRNRVATYIWKLPVTQAFTCAAGSGIWGFPKTVEDITFTDAGGERACRLMMDGRHVLTMSGGAAGRRVLPDMPMITYTWIGGVLHRTAFTAGADDVGISLGGSRLVLGDHPIAEQLRTLGLPRSPLMTVWMGKQHGRFDAPERVGAR